MQRIVSLYLKFFSIIPAQRVTKQPSDDTLLNQLAVAQRVFNALAVASCFITNRDLEH